MMKLIKLVLAYTIICIFSLAAIMLLAIIIHLSHRLQNKEPQNKGKQIRNFIMITIAAVILFEVTLLLVIAMCLQIIMIDGHSLHQEAQWIDHVYYDSFEYMEYFIAICDTSAHLCVLFVFISRYHHTFHNKTIFNHGASLVRALYACATALTLFGAVISILIFVEHTVTEIIILEIVWEILVDFMCLWILYLFISKLYQLLKLSLQSHQKSGRKTDFVKELIEATKASIEHSKSDRKQSKDSSRKSSKRRYKSPRYKSRSPEPKSMYTMTIDGMKIDPVKLPPTNHSPAPSPPPIPPSIKNLELTLTTNAVSDHDTTDNEHTDHENENCDSGSMKGESAAMDLIGVMTKMTILVTFSVFVSVIGVIGNVFIEIEEMKYLEEHDVAIDELWGEILPAVDVVITSLMLYLQFNFTHALYRKVFGRFDMWFLTQCLKCIEFVYQRNHPKDEKTASFLVETKSTCTKSLELNKL